MPARVEQRDAGREAIDRVRERLMAPVLGHQPIAEREVRHEQIAELEVRRAERTRRGGREDRERGGRVSAVERDRVRDRRVRAEPLRHHPLAIEVGVAQPLVGDHLGGEPESADEVLAAALLPREPLLGVLGEQGMELLAEPVRPEDHVRERRAGRLERDPGGGAPEGVGERLDELLPSRGVEGCLVDELDQG